MLSEVQRGGSLEEGNEMVSFTFAREGRKLTQEDPRKTPEKVGKRAVLVSGGQKTTQKLQSLIHPEALCPGACDCKLCVRLGLASFTFCLRVVLKNGALLLHRSLWKRWLTLYDHLELLISFA